MILDGVFADISFGLMSAGISSKAVLLRVLVDEISGMLAVGILLQHGFSG